MIGYRGHRNDKDAKGTLFDHYVWQRNAGRQTLMSQPEDPEKGQRIQTLLAECLRSSTLALPFSVGPPAITPAVHENGLLYIPGRLRDSEHEHVRAAHEQAIIKGAMLRGQPTLAVCAGAWRLWQAAVEMCDQQSRRPQPSKTLSPVKGHAYSRMMSIGIC